MRAKDWTVENWDSIYETSPSRFVTVTVKDHTFIKTNETGTVVLEPDKLQYKINQLVNRFEDSRVIVRPSGTEPVVRVYGESSTQEKADQLVEHIVQLVQNYSK